MRFDANLGSGCALYCSAGPERQTALVTEPVELDGEIETAACSGTVSFEWSWSDGIDASSLQPQAERRFDQAGAYAWTMTARLDDASCPRSGTVLVCDSGCTIELEQLGEIVVGSWAAGSEAAATVVGRRLFVPLGGPGLAIIDFSNPGLPEVVGRMSKDDLGDQAGAMAVSGNRLFVSLPVSRTIGIVDLSDPAALSLLGQFGSIDDLSRLEVRGSRLYAFGFSSYAYPGGVTVYDLSTSIPTELGGYAVQLIDPGFAVSDDGIAFIARTPEGPQDPAGIDVVDMSDPARPMVLTQWLSMDKAGNLVDIVPIEDRLYCTAYWGGVWALDASNLTELRRTGLYDWDDPGSYAISVQVAPPNLFVLRGGPTARHRALDVFYEHPGGLELATELPLDAYPSGLYLAGHLLILEQVMDTNGDYWPDTKVFTFLRLTQRLPSSTPRQPRRRLQ